MAAKPDLKVDQRVKVQGNPGTVKFVGNVQFAEGVWVGIALDKPIGKNDGSVQGVSYFTCEPKHGLYVRPAQVEVEEGGGGAAPEPKAKAAGKAAAKAARTSESEGKPKAEAKPKGKTKSKAKAASASSSASVPERQSERPPPEPVPSPEEVALKKRKEEVAKLESDKQALVSEIDKLKDQHLTNISKADKIERQMKEIEKEMVKTTEEEAKLKQELIDVEEAVMELRKLGKPDTKDSQPKDEEELDEERKREKRAIMKLRSQIQVERSSKELLDLEVDELEIQIEEVKEEIDEAMNPEFFKDEIQIAWHKEALRRFLQDHNNQMKRLRLEEGELKLKKRQSEEMDKEVDVEALKKMVETKKAQYEAVCAECKNTESIIQERTAIRKANDELAEASAELEIELRHEIERQKRRFKKLESVALTCMKSREEYKSRHQEAEAEVARLEIRLQTVKSQKDALNIPTDEMPVVPLEAEEIDAIKAGAQAQQGLAKAVAWALTLSASVKEEAEIGQSFSCLIALHRVFAKGQILTNAIHQHYIADASLAVLQSNAPMEWLCRACLAAAIISYSGVGVLGRLHGSTLEKYRRAIRSPALKSCAGGEKALDAAIAVVLDALMDSLGPKGAPKEALTNLRALGAQLMSAEKSTFKDEPFASWQSASCAIEACRAACGLALYASADAGGSRRDQWQQLYSKADQIRKVVGRMGGKRTSLFDIEPNVLIVSGPAEEVQAGATAAPSGDSADNPQAEELPAAPAEVTTSPTNASAGSEVDMRTLDQNTLDTLLLQVKVLEANAEVEPQREDIAAELDYALQQSNTQLDAIQKAARALEKRRKAGISDPVPKNSGQPWIQAREKVRQEIAHADSHSMAEKQAAEDSTQKMTSQIAGIKEQIEKAKTELEAVEKDYGRSRVEAERFAALQEQVERLEGQSEQHAFVRDDITRELHEEQDRKQKVEAEATEKEKARRELQTKLEEIEARVKKKFSTGMSPEDVIALRRADTRQRREIIDLQCRRSAHRSGMWLPRDPGCEDMLALCETGREARMAAVAAAEEQKAEQAAGDCSAPDEKKALHKKKTQMQLLDKAQEVDKEVSSKENLLTSIVSKHEDELAAVWQNLLHARTGLLLGQASTNIIDLGAAKPKAQLEAQYMKLEAATFECGQLREGVSKLLHEVAGIHDHRDGGAHGSVAFSRYLRNTAQSAQHGPAVKVKIPFTRSATIAGITDCGTVRSLATADQLVDVHRKLV